MFQITFYFITKVKKNEIKIKVGAEWLSAEYVSEYILIENLEIASRICVARHCFFPLED